MHAGRRHVFHSFRHMLDTFYLSIEHHMSINVICIWSHAPRRGPRGEATAAEAWPHHSTGWPANGVHEDAKPREQLHALVAAPRLRVGAIDCIVRTKEAPSSSKEYREGQKETQGIRYAEPLLTM